MEVQNAHILYANALRGLADEFDQEAEELKAGSTREERLRFVESSDRMERAGNAILGAVEAGVLSVPKLGEIIEYHNSETPEHEKKREATKVRGPYNLFCDVVGGTSEECVIGPNRTLTKGRAIDDGLFHDLGLKLTQPDPFYEIMCESEGTDWKNTSIQSYRYWTKRKALVLRGLADLVKPVVDDWTPYLEAGQWRRLWKSDNGKEMTDSSFDRKKQKLAYEKHPNNSRKYRFLINELINEGLVVPK